MNQDTFNMEVRKFLKVVGVTSQREIEAAVERAIQAGRIKGNETLSAKVVLTIDGVDLKHEITGDISLE
jgi:ribosomal protein L1